MTPPPPGLPSAAGSRRQEIEAASAICQISPTRCQARTRLYRDGKLELEGFPVADISEYLADESVTIWLTRAARSGTGTPHCARTRTLTRPSATTTPATFRPGR